MRHTFITKAKSQGISTVLVQQVIGHEKSERVWLIDILTASSCRTYCLWWTQ
ncbi:MAG: hypothetical protein OFPII_26090 [Osedax symbiont Rs1]|nr:MAG: hypothetical protein OFPII_26090 [Osedax symbiont Rs1]